MTPSTSDDIVPAPLYRCPSRVWDRDVLASADESTGSRVQQRVPNRILIIEDDLLIATHIESALADAGFEIIGIATTREEAIEYARDGSLDFAIADIKLADGADGIDIAIELFRLHGLRCIFASAHTDVESRRRAAPAAPLGWLQKPYGMALLTATARSAANEVRGKGSR